MVRILGSTGTRRRRGYQLAALFSVVALLALIAVPNAFAVHKTGAFQLDGNAQQSVPASTPGDDWDNICASNPLTCTFQGAFSASPSATATASSHISDSAVNAFCAGGTNCTVFTGGGSKDPEDISSWNWKTDSGGLPAKDNLAHSFAARYSLPSTGPSDTTCPAPTAGTDTCKLLYFGSDRIANNGDAQEGFWFFQNPITLNADGTFNQLHAVGDLLILSDFSNGGGTSTINIYKWVASGGDVSTHLLSLGGGTSQACNKTPPLPDNDPFCGLVNPSDGTPAPWTFTDKGGNSTFLNGELYEGGVNLSAPSINLGGECFASFASETRSSTSPTATLKDFVLGGFGNCTSGTVTTPQTGAGGTIPGGGLSIGTGSVTVRDHAEVTVTGATIFDGSVTFHLCGPLALNTISNCESGGAQIGSPVSVNNPSPATANSAVATLTSVGRYCWRANYSGDAGKSVPASSDPPSGDTTSTTECFLVNPVTPTLTTTAGSSVTLTNPITDTAKLNGTANKPGTGGLGDGSINPTTAGGPAGGTITFTLFGPGGCSLVPTGFNPITDNVSGDSNTAYTASFTPQAVGKYTWVATYSGDSPNTLGAGPTTCPDDENEAVTVTDTSSVTSTQDWLPNDTATVASGGGTALNGTLTFTLYETADCTGTAVVGQSYTRTLTNATTVADRTKETGNSSYFVTADKTVSWLVSFTSSDSNVGNAAPVCETTSLTIDNDVPIGP